MLCHDDKVLDIDNTITIHVNFRVGRHGFPEVSSNKHHIQDAHLSISIHIPCSESLFYSDNNLMRSGRNRHTRDSSELKVFEFQLASVRTVFAVNVTDRSVPVPLTPSSLSLAELSLGILPVVLSIVPCWKKVVSPPVFRKSPSFTSTASSTFGSKAISNLPAR